MRDLTARPRALNIWEFVTPETQDYISLNLSLLLGRIWDRIKVWLRLKTSCVGKINLIKMLFMPQLLYILIIPQWWFPLKYFVLSSPFLGPSYGMTNPHELSWNNYRNPKLRGAWPSTLKEWVKQLGDTLWLERFIFQHRGCPGKFVVLWSP